MTYSPQVTYLLAGLILSIPAQAGNDNNYTYLALGDSISFGLNPLLLPSAPGQPLPAPDQFTGYPEIYAQIARLQQSRKEVNASCPGETSGSFLDISVPDNGCNSPHFQPPPLPTLPPFKTSIGLHTPYTGSQMAFAVSQLSGNKHIDLVTLSIGGNDILLLLAQCGGSPDCVNGGLGPALGTYAGNLAAILSNIRTIYGGELVLVTYYAPAADLIPVTQALNAVITQVGAAFGAAIADGFQAFQAAAAPYGGDVCKAGLVIKLPDGSCDVHPTLAGQALLAGAVEIAVGNSEISPPKSPAAR